jgi:hypothetical protein
MLDWAHRLTLKAVDAGKAEDSPALRTLVATGSVEQRSDGGHASPRPAGPRWRRTSRAAGGGSLAGDRRMRGQLRRDHDHPVDPLTYCFLVNRCLPYEP